MRDITEKNIIIVTLKSENDNYIKIIFFLHYNYNGKKKIQCCMLTSLISIKFY